MFLGRYIGCLDILPDEQETGDFWKTNQFLISSGIRYCLFLAVLIPSLVLFLLCIIFVFLARSVHWALRLLLANLFSAYACHWIAFIMFFPSPPVHFQIEINWSCASAVDFSIVSTLEVHSTISFYSVMVCLYLKYGNKKIKWQYIVLYIIMSWTTAILTGLVVCLPDLNTNLFHTEFIVLLIFLYLTSTVLFTIIFVQKSYKRGVFRRNSNTRRVFIKTLNYLSMVLTATYVCTIVRVSFSSLRAHNDYFNPDYILLVSANLPSLFSPCYIVLILKPLIYTEYQHIIRKFSVVTKTCCSFCSDLWSHCCKRNRVFSPTSWSHHTGR